MQGSESFPTWRLPLQFLLAQGDGPLQGRPGCIRDFTFLFPYLLVMFHFVLPHSLSSYPTVVLNL